MEPTSNAGPASDDRASLGELESRRAQMFPKLTDAQIARISGFGVETRFADGAVVFEQGDERVPFFVILEGELVVVHPEGKREGAVTVHQAKEFTGEVSMLARRRSLVRGRAKGDLRVIRVEHEKLRNLVQVDPELSDVLMRAFILRRVALLAAGFGDAVIIGSRHSGATLRIREFLFRNGQPYRYVDVDLDSDVQAMLDEFHVGEADIPVLICRCVIVLRNPTNAEIADCLGLNADVDFGPVHDVVICGAGPGGLAAGVYAASEGLDVLMIEADSPGGQAASSSKIENYFGFPTGISGQALTGRALTQAEKFGARLAVARGAVRMYCDETPMRIELANGEAVRARAVVIATGAEYNRLAVEGLRAFEGVGVYYAATFVEAQRCEQEEVIVVGGGNSAGQAAMFLSRSCRRVHLVVRGPDLNASMSRYLVRRIEDTEAITLHKRTRIIAVAGEGALDQVTWRDDAREVEETHPIRHIFTMTGASPNTAWLRGCVAIDDKGFVLTGQDLRPAELRTAGWSLARPPMLFETSQPRVFAVGDVRANSVKRVASAVGEGSVCIQLVHKVLNE
jgi:thioredoxin reductase (NADPH)